VSITSEVFSRDEEIQRINYVRGEGSSSEARLVCSICMKKVERVRKWWKVKKALRSKGSKGTELPKKKIESPVDIR
jgi:hypothetical protein